MRPFERRVLECLIGPRIDGRPTAQLLDLGTVIRVDHTSSGYFITLAHESFPRESRTFHQPFITGKVLLNQTKQDEPKGNPDEVDLGFVVFCGKGELTLECHVWGDVELPQDIRHLPVRHIEPT